MFSFVRVLDGTGSSAVRCVETKAALPRRFLVGSDDKVVSLDANSAQK